MEEKENSEFQKRLTHIWVKFQMMLNEWGLYAYHQLEIRNVPFKVMGYKLSEYFPKSTYKIIQHTNRNYRGEEAQKLFQKYLLWADFYPQKSFSPMVILHWW
jgi:hypothetical protein